MLRSLYPLILGGVVALLGMAMIMIAFQTGAGGLGLTSGFRAPFEHPEHIFLFMTMGVWATMLGQRATIIMPAAMVAMFVTGVTLELSAEVYSGVRMMTLLAILCFALVVAFVNSRVLGVSVAVCSAVSYHYAMGYMVAVPQEASSLFFVFGSVLSMMLVMGMAVCLGVGLFGEHAKLVDRLRASNSFGSFF